MKRLTFFLLIVAGLVLGYVMGWAPTQWLQGGDSRLAANIPKDVVSAPDGVGVIGTFEGRFQKDGYLGKTGGACLIFQVAAARQSCSLSSDCAQVSSETNPATSLDKYCVTEGVDREALNSTSPKSCWYRPDADSACLRGINIMNSHRALTAPTRFPTSTGQGVRWRVLTCQAIKDPGCGAGGVTGVTRDYRYGPIADF